VEDKKISAIYILIIQRLDVLTFKLLIETFSTNIYKHFIIISNVQINFLLMQKDRKIKLMENELLEQQLPRISAYSHGYIAAINC
jgi:hypothetical protein